MGRATFEHEAPFLAQPLRAAAVLCRTEHGNLHTGLLYRTSEGGAGILHLGWQDYLSDEWPWTRLWAAPEVEPERLLSVAGLCRRIWRTYRANGRFPYAIKFAGTSFNTEGQLVLGEGAQGLTCATFILAIFNAMGIALVDEETWPVRSQEDQAFLMTIRRFATSAHLALLSREVASGCKRIHPDEVLGACSCELPAKFVPTRNAADRIVAQLDGG